MKQWLSFLFLVLLAPYCLAKPDTIVDIIQADDRFSILTQLLKREDLLDDLKARKTATLFAPVNEAFEKRRENETVYFLMGRKVSREHLLYHILPVSVKSQEFYNGQLLETGSEQVTKHPQLAKVNKDGKTIHINNAKIVESDLEAANGGVVQVLDSLLTMPVDLAKTLRNDDGLSEFSEWTSRADIDGDLKHAEGYTVFATKGVLECLTEIQKAYLSNAAGKEDLAEFLRHQIHDGVVYSADFPDGKSTLTTLQGERLDIKVDKNNQVFVNDVKVIRQDLLASNGVIHLLEKSISPKHEDFLKFNIRKALIGLNATKFVSLLDENGLDHYLDAADDTAFTVLAPPNNALDENSVPRNDLDSWLRYHIVTDKHKQKDLVDGQLLPTESSDHVGDARQRVRVHVTDQDQRASSDMAITKQSIQFGRAGLVGEPVDVRKSILYPISQALALPRDPLSRLPVNLDLSTFVASLYASDSAQEIKDAQGITLFAPTNDAFGRLGILTKHLLQPESKKKLETIVKFHAIRNLYYSTELDEGEHREETLAGPEINLNKTKDGFFVRGFGAADGSDRSVIGKVVTADILMSNGVIHKVDRVQLPSTLKVSNRDLLNAEGTTSLLSLLEKTEVGRQALEQLQGTPYTILAPSDRAFAKLNLTRLLEDPERLLRIAKLHILPASLPRLTLTRDGHNVVTSEVNHDENRNAHKEISADGTEFATLQEGARIVISPSLDGYTVKVKGTRQNSADIINLGRATNGGGVIELDRVLLPEDEVGHSMPWWKVMLIVLGVLLGIALLGFAAYFGWLWWQRRQGYIHLGD